MMKKTTDYQIFQKHSGNRDLSPLALKKLRASIESLNLLHLRPIIVNKDMEVLDGQHRLHVAEELNIPIYYEVEDKNDLQSIPLLNVQKPWSRVEFLNYYASQNVEDYVNLDKMIKEYELRPSLAIHFFPDRQEGAATAFKQGRYKFPHAELPKIIERLGKLKKIIALLEELVTGVKKRMVLKNCGFISGLYTFLKIEAVDFDMFMNKLQYRIDLVGGRFDRTEYVNMFKNIYNYKNRNPITMNIEDRDMDENLELSSGE